MSARQRPQVPTLALAVTLTSAFLALSLGAGAQQKGKPDGFLSPLASENE